MITGMSFVSASCLVRPSFLLWCLCLALGEVQGTAGSAAAARGGAGEGASPSPVCLSRGCGDCPAQREGARERRASVLSWERWEALSACPARRSVGRSHGRRRALRLRSGGMCCRLSACFRSMARDASVSGSALLRARGSLTREAPDGSAARGGTAPLTRESRG